MKNSKLFKLTTKEIALIGLMVAIIEVCKVALMHLPNIELTTFWIIMFTLYFGRRIFFVIPVFILIEGAMFGFGIWWIMYLYLWPLLAIVTLMFSKNQSPLGWSIISCIFGLLFGFFGAIPYIVTSGIPAAFAWWVAGIPWDLVHGVANFVLMLVLYHPIDKVMKNVQNIVVE